MTDLAVLLLQHAQSLDVVAQLLGHGRVQPGRVLRQLPHIRVLRRGRLAQPQIYERLKIQMYSAGRPTMLGSTDGCMPVTASHEASAREARAQNARSFSTHCRALCQVHPGGF